MKNNLILIIIVCSLSASCKNRFCNDTDRTFYDFYFPFTVNPAKTEYKIGDTAWVVGALTNPMFDFKSGKTRNIVIPEWFYLLASSSEINHGSLLQGAFDFIEVYGYGKVQDTSQVAIGASFYVYPILRDNVYQFRVGLKMNKKGIYVFRFGDNGGGIPTTQRLSPCKLELLRFVSKNNSFVESSYSLLASSTNDYYRKMNIDIARQGWVFEVK